jgi:hypothetical protein
LAPRALRECAPSALSAVVVRPLNFTVRRHSMTWAYEVDNPRLGWVQKIIVSSNGAALRFGHALRLLDQDSSFREFLTQLLASSTHAAFRWETPPISLSNLDRPFEFVLSNDPHLETHPAPDVYSPYFTGLNAGALVLAIPNLGRTATLIVPRQVGEAITYAHLARFLRGAPPDQVHALWRCVAETAQHRLSAVPQWISTAGGGVAWLHVRIENEPKYYSYRPYASAV